MLTLLLVARLVSSSTAMQVEPETEFAQWAGPYNLSALGDDPPGPAETSDLAEIVHAAVLPPPTGAPDMQRVVFFTRPAEQNCPTNVYARSWLWNPDRPSNVALLPIGPANPDGSDDPFCSGHAFDANGRLFVCGGLDENKHCDPAFSCEYLNPVGHKSTFLLDPSSSPPVWVSGPAMGRERWYPTVLALPNGDMLVAGHGAQAEPDFNCPPFYDPRTYRTFEFYRAGASPSFDPVVGSFIYTTGCVESHYMAPNDYPRVHLTSTGFVLLTNASRAQFMNVKQPLCSTPRWEPGAISNFGEKRGENSVHFV